LSLNAELAIITAQATAPDTSMKNIFRDFNDASALCSL
jgi:hypothetical protein